MAITHIDTVQVFDTGFDSTTPMTIPEPTGISNGDILMVSAIIREADPTTLAISGFTSLDQVDEGQFQTAVLYKIASGESGTYSITTTEATSRHGLAFLSVFNGVDNGDIFEPDYVNGTHHATIGATKTPTPQPITTTSDGCMIFITNLARVGADDVTAVAQSSGYTLADSYIAGTTATVAGVHQYLLQGSAGTETPGDLTWTAVTGPPHGVYTLALKESTAGGGGGSTALPLINAYYG